MWVGTTLSALELLTIKSFLSCGHEFHLYAYDEISTPLPEGTVLIDASEILPRENIFRYKHTNQFGHGKGSLGGFSDLFRYKLLFEKGGWWVDMDVTCLKPLNFQEEYVFRTHQHLQLVGNIMKCPAGSPILKKCFDRALTEVDAENCDWHKPIQILVDEVLGASMHQYIRDFSNADSWKIIRRLLTRQIDIPESWLAIHWVNEEWRRNSIPKHFWLPGTSFSALMENSGIEYIVPAAEELKLLRKNLSYASAVRKQLPHKLGVGKWMKD